MHLERLRRGVNKLARAVKGASPGLPVVLTPGAEPGDVAGSRATITGLAQALGLPARAQGRRMTAEPATTAEPTGASPAGPS